MTIVTDDKCDGLPRIDGTTVTVIDVYHAFARDGLEPAEVAHEFGVGLARVHEGIAYYYDHSTRMRDLEDGGGLVPASADREDWEETTPTDAGESLFGDEPRDDPEKHESARAIIWEHEPPADSIDAAYHRIKTLFDIYDVLDIDSLSDRQSGKKNAYGNALIAITGKRVGHDVSQSNRHGDSQ